ncbi:DoxX family protein [Sediminibacterium soli]|uniref:DoxX family protein n=1 Tax=Sediminibacterium soli TaxID=2698829 RepID=UPI00137AADBA|nr:DoxX family protein [Sediminibacterium soli]NCI47423.1 DoxX family protein [Sediminibacterium soli]
MNRFLRVGQNPKTVDIGLLIARVGIASLMLVHGIPKMIMLFSSNPVQFPPVMGMSAGLSLALTVFAEVFCSLLILLGLGTRLAAVPLAITMLVAVFLVHSSDPLSVKELGLLYLLVYLNLLFAGSGKYSLDYLLQLKRTAGRSKKNIEDPTLLIYQ